MGFFDVFSKSKPSDCELVEIFPFSLSSSSFVRSDIVATYTKILTDTLERTHGIPKDLMHLLWDNCVQNESSDGLVTLLVDAMVRRTDLFLVYKSELGVLRRATVSEAEKIRKDYIAQGESADGVYISFRGYRRTEMLETYSGLEFCILSSLHKSVNISKAVQIKVSELRKSTALSDSNVAVDQAKGIAAALRNGKDVVVDAADQITTTTPDISPTEKAIAFLDAKRAFYLDLPISYVSGLQTPGIGSTGEADMRAVERGLKAQYFFPIVQPVLKAIFGIDVSFKSQDFRTINSALSALKDFDLTSDDNLSKQSKRDILARMFDIDPDEEAKAIEQEEKLRDKVVVVPVKTSGDAEE